MTILSECPQCGAPVRGDGRACAYCKATLILERPSDVLGVGAEALAKYAAAYRNAAAESPEMRTALAQALIGQRSYELARQQLESVVATGPASGSSYLSLALCLLAGRSLRGLSLPQAKRVEELLVSAEAFEPNLATQAVVLRIALRRDFYLANGLRGPLPSVDELAVRYRQARRDRGGLAAYLTHLQLRDDTLQALLN